LIDRNVLWSDPTNPGEDAERLKDIPREEIPDTGAEEGEEEKVFAADTTAFSSASVSLSMQSVEKGAVHKLIRPN
jgi:hypothetical protein